MAVTFKKACSDNSNLFHAANGFVDSLVHVIMIFRKQHIYVLLSIVAENIYSLPLVNKFIG